MGIIATFFCLIGLFFPVTDTKDTLSDGEAVVSYISFKGNKRTNRTVILREMTFEVGDTLSVNTLDKELTQSQKNIFNTNLFVEVNLQSRWISEKEVVIEVEVKERLYLIGLPILYLADRSFNEWWYNQNHDLSRIIYGLQMAHSNLSGNADELRLKIYGGFIPFFEVSYGKAYLDKRQRMGLRGGLFYSTQRSIPFRTWDDRLEFIDTDTRTKDRRGAFVEYNLRNALYHKHKLYSSFTRLQINDTIQELNPNYIRVADGKLNYVTFRYDYTFDQRDVVQYPLKGQFLNAGITSHFNRSQNQYVLRLNYQRYMPITKKMFFDAGVRTLFNFPTNQSYIFTNGLGYGNNQVRGYELNVIDGQHYGILQTNLKYKAFDKSFDLSNFLSINQFNTVPLAIYPKVFFDIGYIRNFYPERSNSKLSNSLLYGGGIGVDMVTFYNAALKIRYAVNKSGVSGVYFGLEKEI